MAKRGNGEGSIYRRADGRWVASLSYVDDAGERRRCTVYGRTRKEVSGRLDGLRERLVRGEPLVDAAVTVHDWLERWLTTSVAASDRKPSTVDLYRKACDLYINPSLGSRQLGQLKPTDVEHMLLALSTRGKSGATRRTAYNVLRAALNTAVRDGLVRSNVAARVTRPSASSPEAKVLTPEQVARVLSATSSHRLHALVVILAHTGLRIGEALALRWSDVNLEVGTLRVTGTLYRIKGEVGRTEPKSARSRRTVPLSASAVSALRNRQRTQAKERLAAGPAWRDTGLVFTTEIGTTLDYRNVLRWYQAVARSVEVPGSFHTLRHSAATALMAAGVPLRVVAEILGHSSTRLTADTYSHVSEALARDALGRLSEALGR